jgi:long-chain fatty acid transport protein
MNGDSWDTGWNAAISYQNDNRDLKIAATYRSKVNLTLSGGASGFYSEYFKTKNLTDLGKVIPFNTNGSVTIPLPAEMNLAIAKKFGKTTVEFVFDRTFWSTYKSLDFSYSDYYVNKIFGNPIPKNWKDANAYRLGITHQFNKKLTGMLGLAYDKTPIPDSTVEFSLPDSDKKIISGGLKYKITKDMSLGFSALYAKQQSRRAKVYDPVTKTYTTGEFSEGGAFLMAFGMDYSF